MAPLAGSVLAHLGQCALAKSFERQADPHGTLTPAERRARAAQLRSAHMAALGRKGYAVAEQRLRERILAELREPRP